MQYGDIEIVEKKSKTSKPFKAVIIDLFATVIIIPVAYSGIFEYHLMKGTYTGASDIKTVWQVNHGTEYAVLKTSEGTVPDNDSTDRYSRNVEQGIMVKYDHEFIESLTNEYGCKEYDRLGGLGFYETKSGRRFTLRMTEYGGGTFSVLPYAVEQIYGVTIEDIIADSKGVPSADFAGH